MTLDEHVRLWMAEMVIQQIALKAEIESLKALVAQQDEKLRLREPQGGE